MTINSFNGIYKTLWDKYLFSLCSKRTRHRAVEDNVDRVIDVDENHERVKQMLPGVDVPRVVEIDHHDDDAKREIA